MNKKKVISLIGLVIVVILWGIAPVISKSLFDNNLYSPALLVAVRGLLSCIAMFVVVLITGGLKKISKSLSFFVLLFVVISTIYVISLFLNPSNSLLIRGMIAILIMLIISLFLSFRLKEIRKSYWICVPAGLILGAAYLLQFIGLGSTTPAKNTFLESFSCIAVPICMFILVKEKPSIMSALAAIACFFGSLVLCGDGWNFSTIFTSPTIGDILSALAGIFFGIDIAFTKVFAKDRDSFVYVFLQLLILTVMSFAYAILFEDNIAFSWRFPHLMVLLFLGIGCTAVCWVMRTACIKNVSAVTCAVLMPMSAVVATLTSIIFSMERFSWNVVAGGLIITASIIISGLYDVKREKKERNIAPNEQN